MSNNTVCTDKDGILIFRNEKNGRMIIMKKIYALILLVMLALMLTACGKSEFGLSENTSKQMMITAENASRDAFFMVGSLEVEDGEQVVISSSLKKGRVRVEIVKMPEEQSIDKLPDLNAEPIITADVSSTDEISDAVSAGTYLLKATCLEKATGTVQVAVKPAA